MAIQKKDRRILPGDN